MLQIKKHNREERFNSAEADGRPDSGRYVSPRSTARNALKILELFSPMEPVLGVSEMGRRLGIHKSNVSRLVAVLESQGFLTRTESGRYRLGLHLYAMGSTIAYSDAMYQAALAELCDVRLTTGESAHLAVLVDASVVHLARLHSDCFMKRVVSSWKQSPVHATSTGKVLLAYSPHATVERIVKLGLRPYTPQTITNEVKFRAEINSVRARGHAVDRDEYVRGTSSIAVPVFAKNACTVAAMAVVAPSGRLTGSRSIDILRLLQQAAMRITQAVL